MKKSALKLILKIVAVILLLEGFYTWFFCRFYVEPGYMAIVTSKTGAPLDPGQILARDNQKGIREDVLGEGRHFLNPIIYEHEIVPCFDVPPGRVGVVTAKVGEELPQGEFLADDGQKGIRRRVLGPGRYRINPYGYRVEITDAVSIPIGYAGVITSLSGDQAPQGEFAGLNQKGIREEILQPGLYYVNPREYRVDVLEVGVNQVSLLGKSGGAVFTKAPLESQNAALEELNSNMLQQQQEKRDSYLLENSDLFSRRSSDQPQRRMEGKPWQAATPSQQEKKDEARLSSEYKTGAGMAAMGLNQVLEFPSRDGFSIVLDMTVEFELHPSKLAWIFRTYGDLPAVVDKIIVPQITSISRNKGSEYGAKDFIVGEGREKFQTDLTQALAKTLGSKNIKVHNALIRHVVVPMQILSPIQQVGIAIEQNLTNKELQNTAKMLAELNTEQSLIDQRKQQVEEETRKLKAEIRADQEKQVAEIAAETLRLIAEIRKETAVIEAESVRITAKAEAKAYEDVEGEKAKGLEMRAAALGDPEAYNLYEFASALNPKMKLNVIYAGSGTLWTDMKSPDTSKLGGAEVIHGP